MIRINDLTKRPILGNKYTQIRHNHFFRQIKPELGFFVFNTHNQVVVFITLGYKNIKINTTDIYIYFKICVKITSMM